MRKDRRLLLVIALTWILAGLIDPLMPDGGRSRQVTMFPHAIALAVLLFAWCKRHAAANSLTPPPAAPLLVGILSPLGIPYYGFKPSGCVAAQRFVRWRCWQPSAACSSTRYLSC